MSSEKPRGIIRRSFAALIRLLSAIRVAVLNLVFLAFVVFLLFMLGSAELPQIPEKGALVLNPAGQLVDQLKHSAPLMAYLSKSDPQDGETLLSTVIESIHYAKDDDRINSLVISLDNLSYGGLSKMQEIAVALEAFRTTGKKIIAVGDNYNQDQYWLASQADEIYVNPMGGVLLQGYGLYRSYYKQALDKLHINFHVFRVGEYKSAMEPFLRDDMSEDAKTANMLWLNRLWNEYINSVAAHRKIKAGEVNDYINQADRLLANYGGNAATAAVAAGLIDGVKTRHEMNEYLVTVTGGADKEGYFQGVGFEHYHWLREQEQIEVVPEDHVGLIVAAGNIVNGYQPTGVIGGDSLAELVRQARRDDKVKALVLRVDSGGGSAFASEIIRQELKLFKDAGKPLVISMGSMAASGGYWISAPADEIWATPATLTGSIGIFGAFPTIDNALSEIGINNDGVGTTQLAGALRIDRPLNPIAARIVQSSIEHGYQQFIDVVATGRDMPKQAVEKIAEGRVWSGVDALELGLVDKLGGLQEASASAAAMAGLEDYQQQLIELPLSPQEQVLRQLGLIFQPGLVLEKPPLLVRQLGRWLAPFEESLELIDAMNDPRGIYLQCSSCVAP